VRNGSDGGNRWLAIFGPHRPGGGRSPVGVLRSAIVRNGRALAPWNVVTPIRNGAAPANSHGLDWKRCDRARVARDARFDGRFFTGVLTTRIYCRPTCPVKPAQSRNVVFFPTAAAAEAAGFRHCRPHWVIPPCPQSGFRHPDVESWV